MNDRLDRDFFARPTVEVAQDLLGKIFVFGSHKGIITETEAYIGQDDPACHAARGRTLRTDVMFGPPGYTYVYLIYGMYHCLNFVTEKEGFPAAVLIRGLYINHPVPIHLNGPGKLCSYLNITRAHNKLDLMKESECMVLNSPLTPEFISTPRIGIRVGQDKLWRFLINNECYKSNQKIF